MKRFLGAKNATKKDPKASVLLEVGKKKKQIKRRKKTRPTPSLLAADKKGRSKIGAAYERGLRVDSEKKNTRSWFPSRKKTKKKKTRDEQAETKGSEDGSDSKRAQVEG